MTNDPSPSQMPEGNPFKQGDIIALLCREETKPSNIKTIRRVDELMPQLTRDELKQVFDWITLELLFSPDTTPEERCEILSAMDECPCCKRWLGHNRPPADDNDQPYRRQRSFEF
jgi:hypothetical protein